MTSHVVTNISLHVGRTFKNLLTKLNTSNQSNTNDQLSTNDHFIDIEIPSDMEIFPYYFDELISVLENSYRLDFYDEGTNGWYSIPRNKGFRPRKTNSHNTNSHQKRNRKRQKRYESNPEENKQRENQQHTNDSVKQCEPVSVDNIMDRLRCSKRLRVDVNRTMDNPVPIHSTDFITNMFQVNASNEIENGFLYVKRS